MYLLFTSNLPPIEVTTIGTFVEDTIVFAADDLIIAATYLLKQLNLL